MPSNGKTVQRTVLAPIEDLRPYARNPRRGDVAAITSSLRAHGQYRAIVARTDGEVLAGNHTLLAARELGWDQLLVHYVEVDDDEAARIVLVDNRANDLAGYDDGELAALLKSLPDLDGTGYVDADLAALLESLEPDRAGDDTKSMEPSAEPITQLGDLVVLGDHRLLCGDSSDPLALDRVFADVTVGCVLTDPPYGINLNTDWSDVRGGTYRPVAGDASPFDAASLVKRFARSREQFWFGANYYRRTLSESDLDGSWLVWDKRATDELAAVAEPISADNMIGSGFELVWSRQPHQNRLLRHIWAGYYAQESALERVHPTQKPIALLEEILTRWTPTGCIVADPFAGSGSTLIACENLGRRCYAMEIDAAYCDVIVDRWERHTGRKAVRDGAPIETHA